jgi:hypothetical protein
MVFFVPNGEDTEVYLLHTKWEDTEEWDKPDYGSINHEQWLFLNYKNT